jgi:replication factor A1
MSSIIPISKIDNFFYVFKIHGVCKIKNPIKKIKKNNKKEMQILSFILEDNTGSIKISAFYQLAIELDDLLIQNKFYSIENGKVQKINLNYVQYNYGSSNYEILLNQNSSIKEIEAISNFDLNSNLIPIFKIINKQYNKKTNVVNIEGIISFIGKPIEINRKDTKSLKLVEVIVEDLTGKIKLNIWEENISLIKNAQINQTIKVENSIINNYNGEIALTVAKFTKLSFGLAHLNELKKLKLNNLESKNFDSLIVKKRIENLKNFYFSTNNKNKNNIIGEIFDIKKMAITKRCVKCDSILNKKNKKICCDQCKEVTKEFNLNLKINILLIINKKCFECIISNEVYLSFLRKDKNIDPNSLTEIELKKSTLCLVDNFFIFNFFSKNFRIDKKEINISKFESLDFKKENYITLKLNNFLNQEYILF